MPKVRHSRFQLQAKRLMSTVKPVLPILFLLTVALFVLLAPLLFSLPASNGASPTNDLTAYRRKAFERGDRLGKKSGERWTEVISWEPRAFIYHNFLIDDSVLFRDLFFMKKNRYGAGYLVPVRVNAFSKSKEECEYLIALAEPHMVKTTVVDKETGRSVDSKVRTSSGTFLTRGQDKIIRAIEKRIADFTFIPVEHGESVQVLHYKVGQKYEPHVDYFPDEFITKMGGQRMATMLMYLSDVEEGGETVFPDAKGNISAVPWWNELSECGKKGLSVKPKMGDALLFWSMKPDASMDPTSLHGACPVIRGSKWSCTKWIRVKEYNEY